jgi:hypothetical protein
MELTGGTTMTMLYRTVCAVVAAPLVAAGVATAAIVASGANRRLGATRDEASRTLPGDELLGHAGIQADRAITIDAPPHRVWPWIAQLGQDKAGFYSVAWLENLFGCEIHNADRIVPEWQSPQAGDPFPLHPEMVLRVGRVDPGSVLVATSKGGSAPPDTGVDFTWAFVISAMVGASDGAPATRLHVRERYRASGSAVRAAVELVNLISTFMSWRMLQRIKDLAERP